VTVPTRPVPQFITDFAPVVHLWSEERYLPYSIEKYVQHFTLNDTDGNNLVKGQRLRIQDLQDFVANATGIQGPSRPQQTDLFLTALDEFARDPEWVRGNHNLPEIESGHIRDAPAVLICVDKGDGAIDAFWFYFYSYNEGPYVMGGGPYGNHLGDWEHSLVRFRDGQPELVWMSAHGGGAAYEFDVMEKLETDANRPVLFAGRGTHANYATVGQHSHDLPYHMLSDFTDRGPLWDPSKNYLAYWWDGSQLSYGNGTIAGREQDYGLWLSYGGHWGNQKLPPEDPRQKFHPFEWRYIDGPLGPLAKNLLRDRPCQRWKWWNLLHSCRVRKQLNMGEGLEAEGSAGCANVFSGVRPYFIRDFLQLLTSGGFGCFVIDLLLG
jgi:hypothetical protein